MGFGDEILGSGFARGMAARGKRMAFGDGAKIDWHRYAHEIFQNNPNVAPPGDEGCSELVWHPFRRGNRLYNTQHPSEPRWVWNYDFRAPVGELFFSREEVAAAARWGRDFVVLEPNVPGFKAVARNKAWEFGRWQKLARVLSEQGHEVVQFEYGLPFKLDRGRKVPTSTFRQALAVMANAKLVVTPEGGLHHGAAALGVPAVVLFGGFVPPQVTGYDFHENIAAPGKACGSQGQCQHCIEAMSAISVERVLQGVSKMLDGGEHATRRSARSSGARHDVG